MSSQHAPVPRAGHARRPRALVQPGRPAHGRQLLRGGMETLRLQARAQQAELGAQARAWGGRAGGQGRGLVGEDRSAPASVCLAAGSGALMCRWQAHVSHVAAQVQAELLLSTRSWGLKQRPCVLWAVQRVCSSRALLACICVCASLAYMCAHCSPGPSSISNRSNDHLLIHLLHELPATWDTLPRRGQRLSEVISSG